MNEVQLFDLYKELVGLPRFELGTSTMSIYADSYSNLLIYSKLIGNNYHLYNNKALIANTLKSKCYVIMSGVLTW
jgi:hypothetical protein